MSGKQSFWHEKNRILNIRTFRNFAQIIGEHAVHLCDLGSLHKKKELKGMLSKWVDIHENVKEWTDKICPDKDNFKVTTNDLLKSYTECLADYILDKTNTPEWNNKLTNLVQKETLFFNALSNGRDTKKYWIAYTGAIVQMIDNMERYGFESEPHYDAAANVIRTGKLLGQWLDHILE